MTNKNITIGLIQSVVLEEPAGNLQKTMEKTIFAAEKGARIICLQELFRSFYFPQDEDRDASDLAEFIPGETTEKLTNLAKKLEIVIIVPLYEKDFQGNYYNSAVVIDADGKILGTYRKSHIPFDPLFYEKNYFKEGDSGFPVFHTRYADIGLLICYDQWFPEPARVLALKGAEIIFYPTAIGWTDDYNASDGDWHEAWETVQRAHAIANGVHVASVNRVGREREIRFWGGSFVCNSFGKVLKKASKNKEEILIADLDLSMNKRIRDDWGFLKNRRPESYSLLCKKKTDPTPLSLGYHMPAEWERHDAIWLAWPYDATDFPGRIHKVQKTYLELIKTISPSEKINLLVKNSETKEKIVGKLLMENIDVDQVNFHLIDYADIWMRDYGPIFLVNKSKNKLAMTHWIFNAWGEKYEELLKDGKIPTFINNQFLKIPCFTPGLVLEGGSIEVNGKGTLITTEQCLLNKNRNPGLSKPETENYLKEYLGVNKIIWLKGGIEGDDTDGHIDDVARFVNPTTVLCAYECNKDEANYLVLKKNYEILLKSTDQDGNKLNIIKLPLPLLAESDGGRLPASYANFYIGNDLVLVPVFGHANDNKALKIVQNVLPNRKTIGINCTDLVLGLGTIHCITQQQPAIDSGNAP